MKKTSLVFAILVTFCYAGFADSIHSPESCCPSSTEATSLDNQKRQMQLDQIQHESEEIAGSNSLFINKTLQKAISGKIEAFASMDSIQRSSENISVSDMSEMVAQHLSKGSGQAHK